MQRMTVSLNDELLKFIDAYGERRGYTSRSEVIRDLVRDAAKRDQEADDPSQYCVGALAYVFNHETRDLPKRLTSAQHDHHELSVATLHVHLDHEDCLEVAVLKGTIASVKSFSDAVISQRGVRHGHLHVVPRQTHATGRKSHDNRRR